MAWVIRILKIAGAGLALYVIGGYVVAAVLAVLLVGWLLLSESAVLGD